MADPDRKTPDGGKADEDVLNELVDDDEDEAGDPDADESTAFGSRASRCPPDNLSRASRCPPDVQ